MKCQSLFTGKNKERIINVLSSEFAHGVVKIYLLANKRVSDKFRRL